MKKRLLYTVLALLLAVLSVIPTAAAADKTGFAEFIVRGETSSARPGDQIKMIVTLDGDALTSLDAGIVYDPAFFEYVEGSAAFGKNIVATHSRLNTSKAGVISLFLQAEGVLPTGGDTLLTFELLVKGENGKSSTVAGKNIYCVGEDSPTPRTHTATITASNAAAKRTEAPIKTPTPFDSYAPPPKTPAAVSTPKPTKVPAKTEEATAKPTATPTPVPTAEPTVEPTLEPTIEPTVEPTLEPTATPEPTAAPTVEPTAAPTAEPTVEPTLEPTAEPAETSEPTFIVPDDDEPKNNGLTGAQSIMIIAIAAVCLIAFLIMLVLFLRVRKMR